MLFNEIKKEKPHSTATYQNLGHPSESQVAPPSGTGSCFLPGCFLADHTILFLLIKGPVSLIESRGVYISWPEHYLEATRPPLLVLPTQTACFPRELVFHE